MNLHKEKLECYLIMIWTKIKLPALTYNADDSPIIGDQYVAASWYDVPVKLYLFFFAMIDSLIDIDASEDFCINGSISICISVFRLVSFHFLSTSDYWI